MWPVRHYRDAAQQVIARIRQPAPHRRCRLHSQATPHCLRGQFMIEKHRPSRRACQLKVDLLGNCRHKEERTRTSLVHDQDMRPSTSASELRERAFPEKCRSMSRGTVTGRGNARSSRAIDRPSIRSASSPVYGIDVARGEGCENRNGIALLERARTPARSSKVTNNARKTSGGLPL